MQTPSGSMRNSWVILAFLLRCCHAVAGAGLPIRRTRLRTSAPAHVVIQIQFMLRGVKVLLCNTQEHMCTPGHSFELLMQLE